MNTQLLRRSPVLNTGSLGVKTSETSFSVYTSLIFGLFVFLFSAGRRRRRFSAKFLNSGKNLEGQVALVTGAGRGLGRVIAEKLYSEGALVVGTGLDDEATKELQEDFDKNLPGSVAFTCNVTLPDEVQTLFKKIEEKVKTSPDIVINNAGITKDNLFALMKPAEWQAVIDTNLTSIFTVTKQAVKGMSKKKYGRIVTIGSVVGSSGNFGQVNYASAKAGLVGFTKSVAIEVASKNITVNVVSPGFIRTAMTEKIPEKQKKELLEKIPMKRMGEAVDVAECVNFLISPGAGYVTGANIHVNGGMYMA